MNAEIIAVGSELLLGQISNTNGQFLSRELAELGISVYYHTVVGDNKKRLEAAIQIAEKRADLIIFTGGLGPTEDDLTKEVVADHLSFPLVIHQPSLDHIENYFKKVNRVMTDNNRKQALVISGAHVFKNDNGMAPGMIKSKDRIHYLLLPGPPSEMKPMFTNKAKELLVNLKGEFSVLHSKVLRFFGIGEAQLETEIKDLLDKQLNPTIAPLAENGEVTLRLTAMANTKSEAKNLIEKLERDIHERVGQYLYGYDDSTLYSQLVHQLSLRNQTVTSAESLTGGLFQRELTSINGASAVYNGGLVTYSNEVKMTILGVSKDILHEFGAVSEQCAISMAKNAKRLFHSDYSVSFTGVAGPTQLEGKEVGTVWVGVSTPTTTKAYLLNLSGSREGIRNRSTKYGAFYLLKELQKG
ncbi:damage-inducible protein CinA [Bacillus coahuilensis m2-6]|uniref:competence/damage-inducible protein A n=1 Tax=Bacillus coahuilensis TaxID=408580 RepID=UPI0007501300|nr:competence/damage-inducible protein A [Bacillus coahuilensis]KUP08322.1 damage-inducible protein CinA [Bacillus coahuilensis m2-6]